MKTQKEVETFLAELTALCNKHGLHFTYSSACGVTLYEDTIFESVYCATKGYYEDSVADGLTLEPPTKANKCFYDFVGEK